ncbi:membrane protein [Flavobacterium suaedae]|uniref:Membrane protein n=1 Tax=Flavobacterium suaedae TaxID=1767027 RepID=A0ABQ1JT53_9FLAO|nr:DUF4142 domain-containing protein [Flavobacterium suaedae]GGB73599.1 membrane protein [Flavobacterium suaedae]
MKKRPFLGKMLLGAAVLTMSLGTVSCKEDKNDPAEVAEEQNEEKFDENEAKEDDSEFLVEAAAINMKEIELGKLVENRSENQALKSYAEMLVEEHTKANEELKAIAKEMNVSLPMDLTEDGKKAYENLKEESGEDFANDYVDMMIKDHEEAIDEVEEGIEEANNEKVRAWAADILPKLREHLAKAKDLKEKMESM